MCYKMGHCICSEPCPTSQSRLFLFLHYVKRPWGIPLTKWEQLMLRNFNNVTLFYLYFLIHYAGHLNQGKNPIFGMKENVKKIIVHHNPKATGHYKKHHWAPFHWSRILLNYLVWTLQKITWGHHFVLVLLDYIMKYSEGIALHNKTRNLFYATHFSWAVWTISYLIDLHQHLHLHIDGLVKEFK